MQPVPSRSRAESRKMRLDISAGEYWEWVGSLTSMSRRISRHFRATRRLIMLVFWMLICLPVEAVLIWLPGPSKVMFVRFFWTVVCRILGLQLHVIGASASDTSPGRPVVFASSHSSWLDICVLGARLDGCFIAKEEIGRWPVLNVVARVGRTVFVRRQRTTTKRERDEMRSRLAKGDNLILFPEGTTSDGSRVLPFRTSFFSIADQPVTPDGKTPLVQPVSIAYDRLGFLPTGRATRAMFAWYGDMSIAPHFWRLAQYRGLRATVLLHTPLDPQTFANRKEVAMAAWNAAADGASTLRQNRPARPIAASGSLGADEASSGPAFA